MRRHVSGRSTSDDFEVEACPICSLRSKQHGSYNALSLLSSQSSSELSPLGPLPASSFGASGTLFARLRPSRSGESDGGGSSGGTLNPKPWGPRLAEHLHLGGWPRRSGDGGDGTLQGGGGSGVGEAFSDEEPSSGQHSSGRLPAGMMDERLMPRAAAAEGSTCDSPFGGRPRPSSPLQRSGLTISVGQRPASPGPKAFADATAQAGAPGDPRQAPLPPFAGGTLRRSFSREPSCELPPAEQGPPLERPQRGSSAALEALLGSGGGSPNSPLANASQQCLGASLSPPRSPAPGGPPQQRPQRDYEQPAVLRSPKRGGSGRLTRGGSGTLSALRVSTSASSDSTAFGLLSAAASQLQENGGSGGGFTIWPGAHSGGTSPSSARALGVSSSDSLAAAGSSGSSSASGSADYTSRFRSLSAEHARMAQITGASWVHLLPLILTIVIQQPGSHHRCVGFPSWLGVFDTLLHQSHSRNAP